MLKLLFISILVTLPPALAAQHLLSSPRFARGAVGTGIHRELERSVPYYPFGFYSPLDADYFPGYPQVAQPPVILLQPPPQAPNEPPTPPVQPLVIELQGDRYVRIAEENSAETSTAEVKVSAGTSRSPSFSAAPSQSGELHPIAVVLIFRDGHEEEIPDYTIAGGALYTSADYYKAGVWNRTISLSSLDLSTTIKINLARGLRFQLPSAPNEVIVGP